MKWTVDANQSDWVREYIVQYQFVSAQRRQWRWRHDSECSEPTTEKKPEKFAEKL